jgi:hypothetical protein
MVAALSKDAFGKYSGYLFDSTNSGYEFFSGADNSLVRMQRSVCMRTAIPAVG